MKINRFALGAVLAFALGAPLASTYMAMAATAPASRILPSPGPGRAFVPVWRESLFTPLNSCRVVDTRMGGGLIAANATRTFAVGGTANFPAQGGTNGGCGIPTFATGIVASVTSLGSTAAGNLSIAPGGATLNGIALSFQRGEAATSSVTTKLGPQGNIRVRPNGAASQVVVDVTGYYSPQIAGVIDFNGDIYSNSGALLSAGKWSPTSIGLFWVNLDRDITNCAILTSTSASTNVYSHGWGAGRQINLASWALDSNAQSTDWAGYIYFSIQC